jgi:uncharacterized delta-60 repeat protein
MFTLTVLLFVGPTEFTGQNLVYAGGAGSLDTSFNGTGKVTTSIDGAFSEGAAVAVQVDGKLIVAGRSRTELGPINYSFAVVRYNPNGSLDTTFNGIGKVVTGFPGQSAYTTSMAIQPDGKIVVAGSLAGSSPADGVVGLIIRYNQNGSLDTTFNETGIVTTPVVGPFTRLYAVKLQADGKIVAAGETDNNLQSDFAMFRYLPNGSLDSTFHQTGIVVTDVAGNSDCATSLAIQPDGKIVVAGYGSAVVKGLERGAFALVRYDENGGLDTSFNGTGKVVTQPGFGDELFSVAIQPDGKIIAGGQTWTDFGATDRDFALIRYNPNGTLDTTFNGVGIVTTQMGGDRDACNSIALQSDGKIIASGQSGINATHRYKFATARYNPDGSLDASFNGTGKVITQIGDYSDVAGSVTIQPNGKIVTAGTAGIDASSPFKTSIALARYNAAPSMTPFDYDGDSRTDLSVYRPSAGAWYLLQSLSGFAGVGFGVATDRIVPADYDGDGKTDVAVYRPADGGWYILNSSNGTLSTSTFGVAEDLPAPADYDGDGRADLTVFRPSTASWYRLNSSNGAFVAVSFGATGDKPTVGDFDGDGKADVAVYRPSAGAWYRLNSSNGAFVATQFGVSTDLTVAADYDGDGKTDIGVYRPSSGDWFRLNSSNGAFVATNFGTTGDIPATGDFDGDGKADLSVFRPADGGWYRLNSSNGAFVAQPFGASGDRPTPSAFTY